MNKLEVYKELIIIRSWLDDRTLETEAKQRLTLLIKGFEENITEGEGDI